MIAFAGNSLLTRAGVSGAELPPLAFGMIRTAAGAACLALLLTLRRGRWFSFHRARVAGAVSLALYMIGLSVAYLRLDTGLGAVVQFGVVQMSMFFYSATCGTRPKGRQILGALIAFSGLVLVLWPGPGAVTDPVSALWMALAGAAWAAYTVIGRGEDDPLAANGANFVLCLPIVALVWLLSGEPGVAEFSRQGVIYAVISGAITSGLGYALWYHVLPQLETTIAAVVQLAVPIIALIGGVILLGEAVGLMVAIAAGLVLGGIALAVTAQRSRGSSGS